MNLLRKIIQKEVSRFLISGLTGVFSDAALYKALLYLGLSADVSKAAGFIFGTIVVYFLHKVVTFKSQQKHIHSLPKFCILYALNFTVNVGTNSLFIALTGSKVASFILATGITTLCSYVGQKFWVFKDG